MDKYDLEDIQNRFKESNTEIYYDEYIINFATRNVDMTYGFNNVNIQDYNEFQEYVSDPEFNEYLVRLK